MKHFKQIVLSVSVLLTGSGAYLDSAYAEQIVSDIKKRRSVPFGRLSSSQAHSKSGILGGGSFGNVRPIPNYYANQQLAYNDALNRYDAAYEKWRVKVEREQRKAEVRERVQKEKEYQKRLQEWRKNQTKVVKAKQPQRSIFGLGSDEGSETTATRARVQTAPSSGGVEWKDSPRAQLSRRTIGGRDESGKLIGSEVEVEKQSPQRQQPDFWTRLKDAVSGPE